MKRLHYLLEVFFLFICSLTPILWLGNGAIVMGHDSGFRMNPFGYLKTLWFSWNPYSGFGADVSSNTGFLIAQLPEALFVKLTGSLPAGQTISFIFWFFVIGVSMYILIKQFFPESKYWPLRISAGVFYMYNFYLLQGWFITERAKFSLFAALPLLFLVCWNILSRRWSVVYGGLLFSLILFLLNGGGSPPLYGGILVALGILFLYFIVMALWKKSLFDFFHVVRSAVFIGIATIFVNAYWVFPQLYAAFNQYTSQLSSSGGIAGILSWEEAVNKYASIINLLRLQGIPDWYNNPLHPYSNIFLSSPILIILSFVPITITIYVLMRKELRKQLGQAQEFLFVCLLIFLIGLIMTAGSHPPFGFIYVALLKYVPGFAIFRSAFYKFGPSFWFGGVIVFSASLFIFITHTIKQSRVQKAFFVILISGILFYHFPYFIGNFFLWNKPFSTKVVLPSYVQEMFSYINATYQKDESRVMLLPPLETRFFADSYNWGFWSLDLLARLGLKTSVIANDIKSPLVQALYDAAVENKPDIFYTLTRRLGIQKILWRDDVLYSDKKTQSSNFSYIRNLLLVNPNIYEEKKVGEWTLYSMNDQSYGKNFVSVEPHLYRADIDPSDVSSFFKTFGITKYPLVFSNSLSNSKIEQDIGPFLHGNIFQAVCVFCGTQSLSQMEQIRTVPYVRLLPDSPFYFLVSQKEMKLLRSVKNIPKQRIDADLGLASKRLVEISGIVNRDIKDNTESLSQQIIEGFRKRVKDAIIQSDRLDEIGKNTYRAKIISYLKFYTNYLSEIDEKNVLPKEFITSIYEYLRNSIDKITVDLWISEGIENEKYYLSIPTEDTYQLSISRNKGIPISMRIDNQLTKEYSKIHLKEGVHKIELNFTQNNELSPAGNISETVSLEYSKKKSYLISRISYQDPYFLRFNYKILQGRNMYVAFHQNNDASDVTGNIKRTLVLSLLDDGKWHNANFIINPNFGATSGEVIFYTSNTSDGKNELNISDLSVKNMRSASIFAVRENAIYPRDVPTTQTETINPSFHKIKVINAQSFFILNFRQAYNSGWKAFVVPSGKNEQYKNDWNIFSLIFKKPLDTQNHFSLDGYSNAWYVDNTGNFTVLLVYWPHVIFLVFGICSVVSLIVGLLVISRICFREGKRE